MRFLFEICHPGHVHFFKNVISRLNGEGHETRVAARDKEVTLALLDAYGFPYEVLSRIRPGVFGRGLEFLERERGLVRLLRAFRPDAVTSIGGSFVALPARALGFKVLLFTDTEHVLFDRYLTYPFAHRICTPECFKGDLGRAHVRYKGFHELAYLHPSRVEPDPRVLGDLGLSPGERFAIVRFVSWQAGHDLGQKGFSDALKREAVARLSVDARVILVAEGPLPADLAPLALRLPPHRIHDALAFASVYLGEGATMATEAGFLGTPSVYVSSLVGTMGNFDALETVGLVKSFRDPREAVDAAVQLMRDSEAGPAWRQRAKSFVSQQVDVSSYAHCELVEMAGR